MPAPAKSPAKTRLTETPPQRGHRAGAERAGRSAREAGRSRLLRQDTITAIAREMGTSVEALRDTLAQTFAPSLPPRLSVTAGAPEHLRGEHAIGLSIFSGDHQVSAHVTLTPAEARAAARQLLAEAKAAERHNKARED